VQRNILAGFDRFAQLRRQLINPLRQRIDFLLQTFEIAGFRGILCCAPEQPVQISVIATAANEKRMTTSPLFALLAAADR
jgi:hypothetical protein